MTQMMTQTASSDGSHCTHRCSWEHFGNLDNMGFSLSTTDADKPFSRSVLAVVSAEGGGVKPFERGVADPRWLSSIFLRWFLVVSRVSHEPRINLDDWDLCNCNEELNCRRCAGLGLLHKNPVIRELQQRQEKKMKDCLYEALNESGSLE